MSADFTRAHERTKASLDAELEFDYLMYAESDSHSSGRWDVLLRDGREVSPLQAPARVFHDRPLVVGRRPLFSFDASDSGDGTSRVRFYEGPPRETRAARDYRAQLERLARPERAQDAFRPVADRSASASRRLFNAPRLALPRAVDAPRLPGTHDYVERMTFKSHDKAGMYNYDVSQIRE